MAAGEEGHTAAGAPGYESTALPGSVAERAAPEVKETPRRSSEGGGAAAEGGAARRGSLSSLLRGAARGREEPLKGQDGWPSPAQAGERRNSGPEMQRKGSTFSGRARTADSAGLVQADFAEGSVGIRDLDVQDLQELRELKEARERREQELVNAYIKNHSDAIGGRASLRRSQSSIARMTWKQLAVHRLISHWAFDSGMGVIICCNAMTIGVESTYTAKDIAPPTWVEVVEYIFISVYTVELALRLFVDRLKAFQSLWVKFDAFLVACGLMDIIVKILANGSDVLANVMLVRLLRLARLARAARLLVQFRVLWLLVQGLINSFLTIMWTFVIMVVLIYIFAVLGLEVVRPDEGAGEEYQIAVTMFNDSLGRCMLVLIQFLTLDSIGQIYVPICVAKPYLTIYFAAYLLVVSITLMNLVTALMVDNALSQSARDKEAESAWEAASRKKALPKLKAMFIELDEDGSGNLELEEILNAPEELREQLQQIAKMEDCEELFHTLDFDNSGSIDVEEFCDGVLKASQDNKPMELLRLARQCNGIHDNAKAILQLLKEHLGNKVESDHCGNGSNSPSTLPAAEDRMGKRVSQPLGPCPSDLTSSTEDPSSLRMPPSTEAALGTKMSAMESRLAGLEARIAGMEAVLQRVSDAVVGPAPKGAGV